MRDYHGLTELGRARRLRPVVDEALTHYDLDVRRVRLLTNETNGIFRIDTADGGRAVVRVGLGGEVGHDASTVATELEWLAAITGAGLDELDVPAPEPTRTGARFVTVDLPGVGGPRNVVVFSWLPGPLLGDRLTESNVHRFGAASARLHADGAEFAPTVPGSIASYDRILPFEEDDHISLIDDALLPAAGRARFAAGRDRVEATIERLRSTEAMRVLHGDLHPWNAKVHRGRIGVFDFEDLMWGWPIQDVATTLYYFHGHPDYRARRDAFEAGYRTVATWPVDDDHQLDTFLIGRALVLANFVLASPEMGESAPTWMQRFDRRITALLDGRAYRS